ncbi:conserved exported protein of uncharacterised function [Agrobacterium tumefaciens]|nr:conserved exported protein of uncharacterised function [Agrobacterium tumefaciens]
MGALFWRSAITLCALPNHNAGIQSGESLRPPSGLSRDHIMRNILLLTAAVLFSHSALAAGPTDPVQKLMDITVKNCPAMRRTGNTSLMRTC